MNELHTILTDKIKLYPRSILLQLAAEAEHNFFRNYTIENHYRSLSSICHKEKIFEIFTAEYIPLFAAYIKTLDVDLVLEICAGDGRLSHFLRQHGINVIATDDRSWKIVPAHPVEVLDHKEALKRYKPSLVICCWMPYNADFTPCIRKRHIPHYILIGESHGGCCGADSTWESHEEYEMVESPALDEMEKWQLCRTDYTFDSDTLWSHSRTVHFRRQTKKENN